MQTQQRFLAAMNDYVIGKHAALVKALDKYAADEKVITTRCAEFTEDAWLSVKPALIEQFADKPPTRALRRQAQKAELDVTIQVTFVDVMAKTMAILPVMAMDREFKTAQKLAASLRTKRYPIRALCRAAAKVERKHRILREPLRPTHDKIAAELHAVAARRCLV